MEISKKSGIYEFHYMDKYYIGQSKNINQRYYEHKRHHKNKNNINYNFHFYRALRKYGFENFTFSVLELCEPKDLAEKEVLYIKKFNSFIDGYNSTDGGETPPILLHERNPNAKLTQQDVLLMRISYENNEDKTTVYERYKSKISKNTFNDVWVGKTWKGIYMQCYTDENKSFYRRNGVVGETKKEIKRSSGKLKRQESKDRAIKIRWYYEENKMSINEILLLFPNLEYTYVWQIVNYKSFKTLKK